MDKLNNLNKLIRISGIITFVILCIMLVMFGTGRCSKYQYHVVVVTFIFALVHVLSIVSKNLINLGKLKRKKKNISEQETDNKRGD